MWVLSCLPSPHIYKVLFHLFSLENLHWHFSMLKLFFCSLKFREIKFIGMIRKSENLFNISSKWYICKLFLLGEMYLPIIHGGIIGKHATIGVLCSASALKDCYQILCGTINGSYTFDANRIKELLIRSQAAWSLRPSLIFQAFLFNLLYNLFIHYHKGISKCLQILLYIFPCCLFTLICQIKLWRHGW